jgi:hypothetical protein
MDSQSSLDRQIPARSQENDRVMPSWREQVDELPLETRIKAQLAFALASDRVAGQPVEIAASALRAVAVAEGIDGRHRWIEAAAREIAQQPIP